MMEPLAKFVENYGKHILAVWVFLTILFTPIAVGSFSNFENTFAAQDDESIEAENILVTYFGRPVLDLYKTPLVVLKYDSPEAYYQLYHGGESGDVAICDYLQYYFEFDLEDEWALKLDPINSFTTVLSSGDENSGVLVLSVVYMKEYSDDFITKDVPNLRATLDSGIKKFLWDAWEDEQLFDDYLTGTNVLYHDMSVALSDSTSLAVVVMAIIVVVLAGILLGSVMTSVVMALSTVVSIVASIAIMSIIDSFTPIPLMFVIATVIAVLVMSFTQSVHVISTYRNELILSKNKRKKSLFMTVVKCSKTIVAVGACMALGSFVMAVWPVGSISSLGLCLFVGVVVSVLVSLLFTTSLIGLTKNELFWTNSSEQTIKWKPMKVIYDKAGAVFSKISYFMGHLSVGQAKAIAVSTLVLGVSCFAVVMLVDPFSKNADLTSSMTNGDSEIGLGVLEKYGCGGIVNPYYVIVEFGEPIAHIEKQELIVGYEYVLIWEDSFDMSSVEKITGVIKRSDPNNISTISSLFSWNHCLPEFGTAEEKVNYALDMTKTSNPIVYEVLKKTVDALVIIHGYEGVLDDGPTIDYIVNSNFGLFGFRMIDDSNEQKVVVNHINFIVATQYSSTSIRSVDTMHSISDAMRDYVNRNASVSHFWMSGVPVTYGNIVTDVSASYVILIVLMLIIMFFVMWFIESSWRVSITIVAVSLISLSISLAFMLVLLSFIQNGVFSMFVFAVAPIIIFAFGVWYGHISIATVSEHDSVHRARKNLAPLVIITAVTIIFACVPFMFSNVQFISQIGILFAIILLVDTILIRLLLSPALWTLYKHYYPEK